MAPRARKISLRQICISRVKTRTLPPSRLRDEHAVDRGALGLVVELVIVKIERISKERRHRPQGPWRGWCRRGRGGVHVGQRVLLRLNGLDGLVDGALLAFPLANLLELLRLRHLDPDERLVVIRVRELDDLDWLLWRGFVSRAHGTAAPVLAGLRVRPDRARAWVYVGCGYWRGSRVVLMRWSGVRVPVVGRSGGGLVRRRTGEARDCDKARNLLPAVVVAVRMGNKISSGRGPGRDRDVQVCLGSVTLFLALRQLDLLDRPLV